MSVMLPETWVDVSTFVATHWVATTATAHLDLPCPRMREHVKVTATRE